MQAVCLKAKESCSSQHAHTAPLEEQKMSQVMTAAQSVLPRRLAHKPAPQLRRTRYAGHKSLPSHKSLRHPCAATVSLWIVKGVLLAKSNCRPTQRAPDVWESARFTSIFLALGFSYISSRIHARPHAGNANRWATPYIKPFARFSKLACLSN